MEDPLFIYNLITYDMSDCGKEVVICSVWELMRTDSDFLALLWY